MAKNNKQIIWIALIIVVVVGIVSIRQEKKEAASPLIITDLINIDVSNLVNGISFAGCEYDALMVYIGDASQICCPINYEWGAYSYPQNYYDDGTYTTTAQAHFKYELYSCPLSIPKGRYVKLSYDGTYINVYLPSINTGDWNRLYPSSTGETYYDSGLTNPACTYSNGCIGGVTYSNFLSYKDSYISGGDFTTFITSANNWISS